jgi:GAF domain-containing protein
MHKQVKRMTLADNEFLAAGFRHIVAATDIKTTLSSLVKAAAQAVGSDSGSFFMLNHKTGMLEPYVLVNIPDEYLAGCSSVALGTQCCGRAALHKTPWVVSDMWTDPLFSDCREAALKSGMRAGFSVPVLAANGDCIGTLACQFREPYTPDAYAIERNRLFAQLIAFAVAREQELARRESRASVGKTARSAGPPILSQSAD